ncbi:hypothetical protein F5Y16DRAFT_397330 [Xylariaceae sp. FL0255]|nr:hypothetical protein F5Y16DRAFT_397330 [Xylariaceae sp. FL0255]
MTTELAWLDKTLTFVITANDEAALLCEHSRVDGTSLHGLGHALARTQTDHNNEAAVRFSGSSLKDFYTYLPAVLPPGLEGTVLRLRSNLWEAVRNWTICHQILAGLNSSSLCSYRLPLKSVVHVVIQAALRLHFGYSPNSMDVASQRHFRNGRVELFNPTTREVIAFCDVLWNPAAANTTQERRKMFLNAVRSYSRLFALMTWGRGWWNHTSFLEEQLRPGEILPALLTDPLYRRLKAERQKAFTSFIDFGLTEMGQCWDNRDIIYMTIHLCEDSVGVATINGDGRGKEFAADLQEAFRKIKQLVDE